MDTSLNEIRKIDARIASGEEPGEGQDSKAAALANERRLLEQLLSRHGDGTGWHLASNDPLHRLEIKSRHWAKLARKTSSEMPLMYRIFTYGEMEWWESRSVLDLTDDELESAYIYQAEYEGLVARGKAPLRPIKATDPGEEPSGGELYRIAKALKEGLNQFPYPSALQHRAGVLCSSFVTGGTASQILERAFKGEHTPNIMFTLAEMAAVIPEIGRLVTWLEHGEAA